MYTDKLLIEIICDQFGVTPEQINDDTCIINDLNADSIDIVEVIMSLELAYKIVIEEGEYSDKRTLSQIRELVKDKLTKNHKFYARSSYQ